MVRYFFDANKNYTRAPLKSTHLAAAPVLLLVSPLAATPTDLSRFPWIGRRTKAESFFRRQRKKLHSLPLTVSICHHGRSDAVGAVDGAAET